MRLYHYTSTKHLPFIIQHGYLAPSESNIGSPNPDEAPAGAHLGPDVVWLLDTPDLDHDHGIKGKADVYQHLRDKTEVLFVLELQAIKWSDWEPVLWMNPNWRRTLVDIGGGPEAADHWYVFPGRIHKKRWVSVRNTKTDEVYA
jgi:hypothetical protein